MHAIFTTYLELLAEGNRKDKTIRNNRLSFEKLTTWLDVEGFDAPDLTNIEYKRFVRHLLKDNKASSVGLWHRQIRAAYSHAAELGLVEQNPTAGIGKIIPQQDDEAPHVLNNEELRDVLAACNSDHQRLLVYCFALTGMRSFELARLAWHGTLGNLIDFDAGHIAVIGKKGKHRLVPLHPILAEKLFELRAITGDQPWVFDSRLGGHLHEHSVYMAICNVYERAGIEVEQPTHIFRKSLNTNLTRQGVRHDVLDSIFGWAPTDVRSRYYTGRVTEDAAQAIRMAYMDDPVFPEQAKLAVVEIEPETGDLAAEMAELRKELAEMQAMNLDLTKRLLDGTANVSVAA